MKAGAKSFLWGVHQFAWHPISVALAWHSLYQSWPRWHEWVAIVCHDAGYLFDCPNLDGPEGQRHPLLGAHLAAKIVRLFSKAKAADTYFLTLYHSRAFAKQHGAEPSRLCWADKHCVNFDPESFYLFRARLSGEIKEYRANAAKVGKVFDSDRDWLRWYKTKVKTILENHV